MEMNWRWPLKGEGESEERGAGNIFLENSRKNM
jgi:hypothetical protein